MNHPKGDRAMTTRNVLFGAGLSAAARTLRLAVQADRQGLDLVSVSDHPYFGDRLDAYSVMGVLLGATSAQMPNAGRRGRWSSGVR
jgi:hypothetical protein